MHELNIVSFIVIAELEPLICVQIETLLLDSELHAYQLTLACTFCLGNWS